MSNPLIKPNDPRFQKPSLVDAAGQNRFAEGSEPAEAGSATTGDVFAASDAGSGPQYQPQYEATHQSRGTLLMVLACLGLAGLTMGVVSMSGLIFDLGYIGPLLAVVPAAAAWVLAREELKMVESGAMDESAIPRTRLAFWLGVFGMVASAACVATMIWREMNFLPDLF